MIAHRMNRKDKKMGGPKRRHVQAVAALQMGGGLVREGEAQLTRLAQTTERGHCRAGVTGASTEGVACKRAGFIRWSL